MNSADLFYHACALRGMAGDMGTFGDNRVPCIVKAADRLDQMRVALGILNLLVRCADMAKEDGQPQCINHDSNLVEMARNFLKDQAHEH